MKIFYHILRRPTLTLIEILIVFALIAAVTGIIGINVQKAVREQRFRSEFNKVFDTLRLAQDILLIVGIGTTVKFQVASPGGGIAMSLVTKLPLPGYWENILKSFQAVLSSIHWLQMEGVASEGQLEIQFPSEEAGMTKGILRLSTSRHDEDLGALTYYICLSGYPSPIEKKNQPRYCELEKEEEFLKNLSSLTYNEISEFYKSTKPDEEDNP